MIVILALGLFKTLAGWIARIFGALAIIAFPVACSAERFADIQHGLFIAGIIAAAAVILGALSKLAGAAAEAIEERM